MGDFFERLDWPGWLWPLSMLDMALWLASQPLNGPAKWAVLVALCLPIQSVLWFNIVTRTCKALKPRAYAAKIAQLERELGMTERE